jgi:hypothetical protein
LNGVNHAPVTDFQTIFLQIDLFVEINFAVIARACARTGIFYDILFVSSLGLHWYIRLNWSVIIVITAADSPKFCTPSGLPVSQQ